MEKVQFDVPAMYGDHHVTAVRDLLLALPGVNDIYASAAFQQVLVSYDPEVITLATIEQALTEKGYQVGAAELAFATRPSERATRHTAARFGAGDSLSFAEAAPPWKGLPERTRVESTRRCPPLWPCPGFEVNPQRKDRAKWQQ